MTDIRTFESHDIVGGTVLNRKLAVGFKDNVLCTFSPDRFRISSPRPNLRKGKLVNLILFITTVSLRNKLPVFSNPIKVFDTESFH